jgi:TolA-binding protein
LELEATWLEIRALDELGERARARQRARTLIRRWPDAPQAKRAKQRLEED